MKFMKPIKLSVNLNAQIGFLKNPVMYTSSVFQQYRKILSQSSDVWENIFHIHALKVTEQQEREKVVPLVLEGKASAIAVADKENWKQKQVYETGLMEDASNFFWDWRVTLHEQDYYY